MAAPIVEVDLTHDIGLWQVLSSSSSVYYVDTLESRLGGDGTPRFLRARGSGPTGVGAADDEWRPLFRIRSIPVRTAPGGGDELDDTRDEIESVLRVGCRHFYFYDLDRAHDGWWLGRTVERIIRLKEMPPAGQRTKHETGGREW
jgi:hypothetical protein